LAKALWRRRRNRKSQNRGSFCGRASSLDEMQAGHTPPDRSLTKEINVKTILASLIAASLLAPSASFAATTQLSKPAHTETAGAMMAKKKTMHHCKKDKHGKCIVMKKKKK
jgi:hypothetical protein